MGPEVDALSRGEDPFLSWYRNGCRTPHEAHATCLSTLTVTVSKKEEFLQGLPMINKLGAQEAAAKRSRGGHG